MISLKFGVASRICKALYFFKNPKFEIYQDKKKEYRFRLKAASGQIIATGEGYKELKSCKNGISSIKKNAPAAKIVQE